MLRRFLMTFVVMIAALAGLAGGVPAQRASAQTASCAGLPVYSQAMLAEEQRYADQMLATLDLNDLRAIAAATPEQLTAVVEIIDQHLKNLDQIAPPPFAVDWHMALASQGDLTQAAFADGAINGIFTILVDYYDQSIRSDREIAEARAAAIAICPEFEAFATQIDQIDGNEDSLAPGFTPWSSCTGLDQLGVDIGRANLEALVDVPGAIQPLIAFAGDWEVDPSISWNQLQFFRLADYYVALANRLERLTAPDYAAAWLQSTIAFDRALADLIRGAYGVGILAASNNSGASLLVATQALDTAIASASGVCPQFGQFAGEN